MSYLFEDLINLESLIENIKKYIAVHPEDTATALTFLIYIEDMYDKGRALASVSAHDAGYDDNSHKVSVQPINSIMDNLRATIREIVQQGDYSERINSAAESLKKNWEKRI